MTQPTYGVGSWDDDDEEEPPVMKPVPVVMKPAPAAVKPVPEHDQLTSKLNGVSDTVEMLIDINKRINATHGAITPRVGGDRENLRRMRNELVKSLMAQATVLASMEMTTQPS